MTTTYAGFHEGLFCAVHEFTKENRTIHVVAGKKGTLTWSVNRFWAEVFGTGLVKTAEDFGLAAADLTPAAYKKMLEQKAARAAA